MKRKILFVVNSLDVGGAEKSLTSLLNVLDYSRYDVELLMFRVGGLFLKLLPKEVGILPELDFVKSNGRSLLTQIKHPQYFCARVSASIGLRLNKKNHILHDSQCYWKYMHNVVENLEENYDVAIAWGQGNPTHYVAEKVTAEKKIAFINADYEAVGHNKRYDFPFYMKYNYIVTVSDKLAELVAKAFPDMKAKIKTIYDINDGELINHLASKVNPFVKDCISVKIVTVGRLVEPKGYDLAVEACKKLVEQGLDFHWFIVGEGPERTKIEKAIDRFGINDYMILLGAKNNPYIYMKNADIYVQTSRVEGYCLTLGEARILNTPVISTNFDAVHNQLKDGENGLIVDMNGEAIANAIMRLISDQALREYIIGNLKREKKGNVEEIRKLYELMEG